MPLTGHRKVVEMSTRSVPRVPGPLLSLQEQSAELVKVAVVGTLGDQPAASAVTPVELLKRCQQLTQSKYDLQKRIDAAEVSIEDLPPGLLTEENVEQVVRNLEKDVENLRTIFLNKTLVLDRLNVYDVMQEKLLEKSPESQLLCKTVEHSVDLCTHIMQSQKETSILEEQVMEVRKKRMQLTESAATLMAQLKKEKENPLHYLDESENPKIKKIKKRLAKEREVTTVLQNVFQRLIIASRANWAEDPKLRDIVPTLGKSTDSF